MSTLHKQALSLSLKEMMINPYPSYEKLRAESDIYYGKIFRYAGWYVTGHKKITDILKHPAFQTRLPIPTTTEKYVHLKKVQENMLLFQNHTDHLKLRRLIHKVFTPAIIEKNRTYMELIAQDLLRQQQGQGQLDVVNDYALPFASLIIAKILGVPKADWLKFRKWALVLVPTIDFARSRITLENGEALITELFTYFHHLIEGKRQHPDDDLISQLLQAKDHEQLTTDEIIATCILLIIAGHETTINLISNAVLLLLKHPTQLELFMQDEAYRTSCVEEVLRYESPTQLTARVVAENISFLGVDLKKGDQVYLLLGAGNRDAEQFEQPDVFDITRKVNPHLAFGVGSHFCVGASLARLEAKIALEQLWTMYKNVQLVDKTPQWRKLLGFRSLQQLQISYQ